MGLITIGIKRKSIFHPQMTMLEEEIIGTVSSGLIVYRKRTLGPFYYIDYSEDGGATWDLGQVRIVRTEDNIIINIDDSPAGYREQVRGTNYYIDHALTPLAFAGVENTDWEWIYQITN